jgi:hypothetical protein
MAASSSRAMQITKAWLRLAKARLSYLLRDPWPDDAWPREQDINNAQKNWERTRRDA